MTPREFIKRFRDRSSPSAGNSYANGPIEIETGDTVGVVLMCRGGAESIDEVESSVLQELVGSRSSFFRNRLALLVARKRAKQIREGYEQIGGRCPQHLRTNEQAHRLEKRLYVRFGETLGVNFKAYVAALSAPDTIHLTLGRMRRDKVDRVVVVPLYPQYSRSAAGLIFEAWSSVATQKGRSQHLQTTFVREYATHPNLLQALSERIDEALQRFPRHARRSVPFVFSAPARPLRDLTKHNDPFNEQVQSTARAVMAYRRKRDGQRPFYLSFQRGVELGKMLSPRLDETLEQLVDDGHTTVLVIPVANVSDCVETVYGLDIALREKAKAVGFDHFEVTSALNSHPLFIDTLADCVVGQVRVHERRANSMLLPVDRPPEVGQSNAA